MIHHLNLASMRKIDATYGTLEPAHAVCHALLVPSDAGLVLVESGLGLDSVTRPAEVLDDEWVELTEPVLDPAETAIRQIERLGHDPKDVRHIVLTHLDVDHAGGLPDFPWATVHLLDAELRAALAEAPSRRYRPAHWGHGPDWETYGSARGESWFGFQGAQRLTGLPPTILLVPLQGHSAGHAGVAVRDGDRWILHAGDAYFYHRQIDPVDPHGHPMFDIVQESAQVDKRARLSTLRRLGILARRDEVSVISAHDPWEYAGFAET